MADGLQHCASAQQLWRVGTRQVTNCPRQGHMDTVCGRPIGFKGSIERFSPRRFRCFRVSGLLMQPSSRLLACMEIAGRVHPEIARSKRLVISLVFPTPSLTVAPYLSIDLPCVPDASSPGGYTAAAGALYDPPCAISAQTVLAIWFAIATVTGIHGRLLQWCFNTHSGTSMPSGGVHSNGIRAPSCRSDKALFKLIAAV